jgi:lipoprotein-anchoring transpeptidase ErfK/SrfK
MVLNRRHILAVMAASLVVPTPVKADRNEPFPVFASDVQQVAYKFRRREVDYDSSEAAGTIVIDSHAMFLYLVTGQGRAIRYGVGVGRAGSEWSGTAIIKRKTKWPKWTPTVDQRTRSAVYEKWAAGMPGGLGNPLGARALYLYQDDIDTLYRIHGTEVPSSIGHAVSSGCIRMINVDVADLYDRVDIGTRVVVLGNL